MPPLWRSAPVFGVLGWASLSAGGCSGQQLEGRWRGPFPLDGAKECVLNLYSDHRFDIDCNGDLWIGGGKYRASEDSLTFNFSILDRRRTGVLRAPKIKASFDGRGNEIWLTDAGQTYRLSRRL